MPQNDEPREPITPESAWKSLDEREEPMKQMTTEELCAKARWYDQQNVWAHWAVLAVILFLLGSFSYNVFHITDPWIRLGQAWILGAICLVGFTMLQRGPRRIAANEPCASFLEREFEGKRDGMLNLRRALFLLIPGIAASWWGGGPAVRAKALGIDPSSWPFQFAKGPWPFVIVGLILAFIWFTFGKEAQKANLEVERIRRGMQGGMQS